MVVHGYRATYLSVFYSSQLSSKKKASKCLQGSSTLSQQKATPILSRAQSNDKWSRSQLLALFSPRYTYFAETTSRLNLCLKI